MSLCVLHGVPKPLTVTYILKLGLSASLCMHKSIGGFYMVKKRMFTEHTNDKLKSSEYHVW